MGVYGLLSPRIPIFSPFLSTMGYRVPSFFWTWKPHRNLHRSQSPNKNPMVFWLVVELTNPSETYAESSNWIISPGENKKLVELPPPSFVAVAVILKKYILIYISCDMFTKSVWNCDKQQEIRGFDKQKKYFLWKPKSYPPGN